MSVEPGTMESFEKLELALGYRFRESQLLKKALVHSSHAHEQNIAEDNEQMEFLGDAVLGLLVSDLLFRAHPDLTEGELSKLKGFFVSSANLVKYAEQLELGRYLFLGRGEEKTGGRTKQALLVDALEAIIGAIYLDGGLDSARQLITRFMEPQLGEVSLKGERTADFKTALQELLQVRSMGGVHYVAVAETGPDHEKLFTVDVELDGKIIARGIGLTKKAAEQAAAKQALTQINPQKQDLAYDRTDIHKVNSTRIL
jgi:ribonuclease-3